MDDLRRIGQTGWSGQLDLTKWSMVLKAELKEVQWKRFFLWSIKHHYEHHENHCNIKNSN